jgi:hypothetical protein
MAGFEVTLYGRFWVTPEVILMRDDLVDCCFHSIFLDPAARKWARFEKVYSDITGFWAAPLRERERAVRFV